MWNWRGKRSTLASGRPGVSPGLLFFWLGTFVPSSARMIALNAQAMSSHSSLSSDGRGRAGCASFSKRSPSERWMCPRCWSLPIREECEQNRDQPPMCRIDTCREFGACSGASPNDTDGSRANGSLRSGTLAKDHSMPAFQWPIPDIGVAHRKATVRVRSWSWCKMKHTDDPAMPFGARPG